MAKEKQSPFDILFSQRGREVPKVGHTGYSLQVYVLNSFLEKDKKWADCQLPKVAPTMNLLLCCVTFFSLPPSESRSLFLMGVLLILHWLEHQGSVLLC